MPVSAVRRRWNRKGEPVVYTAQSRALVFLEILIQERERGVDLGRYSTNVNLSFMFDCQRSASNMKKSDG
jgi:RES domain-containing protein